MSRLGYISQRTLLGACSPCCSEINANLEEGHGPSAPSGEIAAVTYFKNRFLLTLGGKTGQYRYEIFFTSRGLRADCACWEAVLAAFHQIRAQQNSLRLSGKRCQRNVQVAPRRGDASDEKLHLGTVRGEAAARNDAQRGGNHRSHFARGSLWLEECGHGGGAGPPGRNTGNGSFREELRCPGGKRAYTRATRTAAVILMMKKGPLLQTEGYYDEPRWNQRAFARFKCGTGRQLNSGIGRDHRPGEALREEHAKDLKLLPVRAGLGAGTGVRCFSGAGYRGQFQAVTISDMGILCRLWKVRGGWEAVTI